MADERKNVLPVIQQKWDPWKMYDISQSEQNAIKERAEKRMILKAEWQKKVSDPYIQSDIYENTTGAVFDPAVQRFIAMRATQFEPFKVTPKTTLYGIFTCVIPVGLLFYITYSSRMEREARYRAGEVKYKDRDIVYT